MGHRLMVEHGCRVVRGEWLLFTLGFVVNLHPPIDLCVQLYCESNRLVSREFACQRCCVKVWETMPLALVIVQTILLLRNDKHYPGSGSSPGQFQILYPCL